ncbi:MAG: BMP family ABC transporter substrate-binding protein [Spirochaetaceae bacterium]|jgi:basic membrane protein A|nr:BMP family ABC transporter substrate-binding protein [Spirochaetaceae bacterium]
MKKIRIICCILAGFLLAAGCRRGKVENEPRTAAPSEVTTRLLTDASGVDDKSFNAAAWRGILEYYGDTWDNASGRGKFYDVVTALTQDQYIPNIQQATDENYDLIITTGFTFADALAAVASKNPNQKYMIIDVDWVGLPNVLQATFAEHEGSYLVGVAAALKAVEDKIPNPRFGFIGGIPGATITKFEVGFVQGVLSVLPNARIDDYYVNDWADPASAKSQAKNWYDSGIYIIYSAAGASGNGTIAQAKEYRAQGKNVWAIGVDSDQFEEGLYNDTESAVYTSMLKRVESATLYGLKAVKDGHFRGEVLSFDLKAAGIGYSVTNPAMSGEVKSKVSDTVYKIISGDVTIAATYADAKQLAGFPQNLLAKDDD